MNRREFLKAVGSSAGLVSFVRGEHTSQPGVPPLLKGYESLYRENPRKAAIAWFQKAHFGLFMHYGVYSLLGRGEWVMLEERIPVAEYGKLKDRFTAEKFDADAITDLALAAGMKYVNITSRHHDSFCLFRTSHTDFSSVDSPAKRDLVDELAKACRPKGLGLFLYYSYALDWRHPYFFSRNESFKNARPAYDKPEPTYLFRKDEDFKHYIAFVHAQIRELLTQYGPLAGLWLDPLMGYYARPELFPIEETYALIRSLQPSCLISFKQGANGDEDFVAPERKAEAKVGKTEVARKAQERNKGKPIEVCNTLQPHAWGYDNRDEGKHKDADEVMRMLADADERHANLLLNAGPLPDGSIHPDDVKTLRAVGRRLRG
jgi:alpha-L-fucosidase